MPNPEIESAETENTETKTPETENTVKLIQDINKRFSTYSSSYENLRKGLAQAVALSNVNNNKQLSQILNNNPHLFEIKEDAEDVIPSIISRLSVIDDLYAKLLIQQNEAMSSIEQVNEREHIYVYFEKLKYLLQQARLQYTLLVDQYLDKSSKEQPYAFFDGQTEHNKFNITVSLMLSGDPSNTNIPFLNDDKYYQIKKSLGPLPRAELRVADANKNDQNVIGDLQKAVGIFSDPNRIEADQVSEALTKLNAIALRLHGLHEHTMRLMVDSHRREQISQQFQILRSIVDKAILNCYVKLFAKTFSPAATPSSQERMSVEEKSQTQTQDNSQSNIAVQEAKSIHPTNNSANLRDRVNPVVVTPRNVPRREPWYRRIASGISNFINYCRYTTTQRKFIGGITAAGVMSFLYSVSSIGSMIGGPYGALLSLLGALGLFVGGCIVYGLAMAVMYGIEKNRRSSPLRPKLVETDPSVGLELENIKELKARISKTKSHSVKVQNTAPKEFKIAELEKELAAARQRIKELADQNAKLAAQLETSNDKLKATESQRRSLSVNVDNLTESVGRLSSAFMLISPMASSNRASTSTTPHGGSIVTSQASTEEKVLSIENEPLALTEEKALQIEEPLTPQHAQHAQHAQHVQHAPGHDAPHGALFHEPYKSHEQIQVNTVNARVTEETSITAATSVSEAAASVTDETSAQAPHVAMDLS